MKASADMHRSFGVHTAVTFHPTDLELTTAEVMTKLVTRFLIIRAPRHISVEALRMLE